MGKAEGMQENWHGHVTALTVAPEYRKLGVAAMLMSGLEQISEKKQTYFVDLFVRVSNKVAVDMYKRLGYSVYRRVLEYYLAIRTKMPLVGSADRHSCSAKLKR
ncbi:hypothetical protein HPB48_014513 [Haemaphysalis longicornis]|uniref:N-alpha-acetyltransferase 20 n=1 Tax=Haemaphysalis longicornis TaxID=44386 RepID=A0A9J6GLR2_HAELO|nr:hypothetical protein HPB48_014513 [Haemaphysalis longicornis]